MSREPTLVNKLAAEFFGTGALVAMSSVLGTRGFPDGSTLNGPVIIGLVVAGLIYALGGVSGAHFNPAVTLALTVSKRQKPIEGMTYWLVQVIGGFAGQALASVYSRSPRPLFPEFDQALRERINPLPNPALGATFVFTAIFVAGIWVISFRAKNTLQAGMMVGGSLTVLLLIAGHLPNFTVNPLAILSNADVASCLASLVGGSVAGIGCHMIFGPRPYEELV